jgi:hypothetical protein
MVNSNQKWQQASQFCRKLGGHLPFISTPGENQYISTKFTTVSKSHKFIKESSYFNPYPHCFIAITKAMASG